MMISPGGREIGHATLRTIAPPARGPDPMPSSPERIASNRANAARSTGPKTSEGKARSRGNALTHGLSGAGIAIPGEDAKVVEARFEALAEDLKARGERERILAHRAAFLALRLERCARYEAAVITDSIRFAGANFDDARKAAVEDALARLPAEPATSLRRLGRTPEGVEWLVGAWDRLLGDLDDLGLFTFEHVVRAENLTGRRSDEMGLSRVAALTRAMSGDFRFIEPPGSPTEPHDPARDRARSDQARADLRRLLLDGGDRARDLRAALPLDEIARSRDEAALRCLFNPSQGAATYRRYEAAAARELHDTLAQFDGLRDRDGEGDEPTPTITTQASCGELASFRTEAQVQAATPDAAGQGPAERAEEARPEQPGPTPKSHDRASATPRSGPARPAEEDRRGGRPFPVPSPATSASRSCDRAGRPRRSDP